MRTLLAISVLALPAAAAAQTPSYAHDVRAVFARAGCNQGTCHGNLTGKGGMKLSLRGENPASDLLVFSDAAGETTVVARYLDAQATVPVSFVADRPNFAWTGPNPANYVDDLVFAQLKKLRIEASPDCSDTEFVRRVHLDVSGILPT